MPFRFQNIISRITGGIRLDFVTAHTPVPDDSFFFRGLLLRETGAILCVEDSEYATWRLRRTRLGNYRVDSSANSRITNEPRILQGIGGLWFTPEGYLLVDSSPVLWDNAIYRLSSDGGNRKLGDGTFRTAKRESADVLAEGRVAIPGGLALNRNNALYIQKVSPSSYRFISGVPVSVLGVLHYTEVGDVRVTSTGQFRLTSFGNQRVTIGDKYILRMLNSGEQRFTSDGRERTITGDVLIPRFRRDSTGKFRVDSDGNSRVTRGDT